MGLLRTENYEHNPFIVSPGVGADSIASNEDAKARRSDLNGLG